MTNTDNFNKKENINENVRKWVSESIKAGLIKLKDNTKLAEKINEDLNDVAARTFYYKIDGDEVKYEIENVKLYLEAIKDKERNELKDLSGAWILAVQIALESLGYEIGKIDGIFGGETANGVLQFQRQFKLKEDGLPGKETINKLCEILNKKNPDNKTNGSGTDQQESQQTSSTSSSESSESSTTTTAGNESTTTSTTGTDNNETANTPSESKEKERNDGKVSIEKYIPGIKYDLKYATKDNSFGGKIMYKKPASEYLRMTEDAAKKLSKAQEILKKQGYELKIWDAFRDHDAQMMLRNNYKGPDTPGNPKSNNVAIPVGVNYFHPGQKVRKKGTGSHHGSGKAIDLTLVDSKGNELEMPTKFDDFSGKAKWNSVNKLPKNDPKRKNAYILRNAMEQAGLYAIGSEWWHYQTNKPKHSAPRA